MAKNSHRSLTGISRTAWAKINLDLLIMGRREDGYHLLDSLVVFAEYGDEIYFRPSMQLKLEVTGPFAKGLTEEGDNLVLKTAKRLRDRFNIRAGAEIMLVKNLPVSSGIGGGSADAAATLRGLRELWNIPVAAEMDDLALSLGADVPACMLSKTQRMTGIGEILSPVSLEFPLFLLLANPGIEVSTSAIFRRLAERGSIFSAPRELPDKVVTLAQLKNILDMSSNDLLDDACAVGPEIKITLDHVRKSKGCIHADMSGSGATCYGIFSSLVDAQRQQKIISRDFPKWWVMAVKVR